MSPSYTWHRLATFTSIFGFQELFFSSQGQAQDTQDVVRYNVTWPHRERPHKNTNVLYLMTAVILADKVICVPMDSKNRSKNIELMR